MAKPQSIRLAVLSYLVKPFLLYLAPLSRSPSVFAGIIDHAIPVLVCCVCLWCGVVLDVALCPAAQYVETES